MPILDAPARALKLSAITAPPFAVAGLVAAGPRGAAAGMALWAATLIGTALSAEAMLVRAHLRRGRRKKEGRASGPRPDRAGLARSFERVMALAGGRAPRLRVFADPAPNALVGRSLGGAGTILVSQGLLALLDEGELRAVLFECVSRLRAPGIGFRTFCAVLAGAFLGCAPRGWRRLMLEGYPPARRDLGPASLIAFALCFAPVRALWRMSRFAPSSGGTAHSDPALGSAMRKLNQAIRFEPGLSTDPAACQLYLVDPSAARALLPL